MIWVTLLMLTNFLQLLMLMKKTAQQTNINVEEPVQKVAMTKVLVDKSTQTDNLGGSYNLQFVLNRLL
jgi:hypothetical protein